MTDAPVPPSSPPPPRPGRRRLLLVVIALAIVGLLVAMVVDFTARRLRAAPVDVAAQPGPEQPKLAPMAPIAVAKLPPLPDTAAVAAEADAAKRLVEERRSASLDAGFDGLALAWAEALVAADRARPPLPQSASAVDLALGGVRPGAAVVITGRLDENVPVPGGDERWRWAVVSLDAGQQVLVLAPPDSVDLVLGAQVQLSGRFLGLGEAPTESGTQRAPIAVARALAPVSDDAERNQIAQGLANLREFHQGRMIIPDDLYAEIDEERPILETRPYYYTLGQVKLDRSTPGVYDEAGDGNATAARIHREPTAFRGKPFRITGTVHDAWEDQQVAKDRPFEVVRVLRVLLRSEDYGPIAENINGVERTSTKWVLRLYELAVASDQPLPRKNQRIAATGRFLKLRAIPVTPDQYRDRINQVTRQSDKVYTFLFVAPAYEVLPAAAPAAETPWWHLVVVLAVSLLAVLAVVVVNRGRTAPAPRRVREEALQYRKRMRAKPAEGAAPAEPPAAPPGAPPPA